MVKRILFTMIENRGGVRKPGDVEATLHLAPISRGFGRYLDALAWWAGEVDDPAYEGEPAMRLERAQKEMVAGHDPAHWPHVCEDFLDSVGLVHGDEKEKSKGSGEKVIDIRQVISRVVQFHSGDSPAQRSLIASALSCHLALMLFDRAVECALEVGSTHVGFSGGVAVNSVLGHLFLQRVSASGLQPVLHSRVPPGDAGVWLGQAAAAILLIEGDRINHT